MNPRIIFYLFAILASFFGPAKLKAQQVADAWVYGGNNSLNSSDCYVDNAGNRYQVVYTNQGSLEIDSLGYTQTLASTNSALVSRTVIIKFNEFGQYLYHINIPYSTGNFRTSLTFDADNNAYFICKISSSIQTFTLFDFHNNPYTLITSPISSNTTTVLCKLTANGGFDWIRVIFSKNTTSQTGNDFLTTDHNKNELKLKALHITPNKSFDTIFISSNSSFNDTVIVNSFLIYFTFSINGQLKKVSEPIKNCLNCKNITSTEFDKHHKHKLTSIHSFTLFQTTFDTLYLDQPTYIYPGYNKILIATNEKDSIIWSKSILNSSNIPNIDITSDTNKNNIDLIIYYNNTNDFITFDSSLNDPVNAKVYAVKMDPSTGLISDTKIFIHEDIAFYTFFRKTSWNPIAQKYFYSTYNSYYHLDSNFKVLSSYKANPGIGGMFNFVNTSSLHIDPKGYTYITGKIYDSISYECFTRYANPNHAYHKVVVTKIAPLITINSTACKPVVSPSGRYTWDTSGVYYDTIPSITNCDSVLEIRFTNLSSKMIYDTSVLVFMQSPSGKYIWDSTGIYNDTLTNRFGCDSLIIFNLKVLQTKHTIDTNVCNKYLSPSGMYWFDSTGTYTDTIPNTAGADSIITINLKVLRSFSSLDTSFCGPISSPSGKFIYNTSGMYTDTLSNAVGCDSIISISFSVQQTTDTISVSSCNSLMSPSGKYTYLQTGTYTDTLQTTMGCDSIIWINYTNQKTSDTITIQRCDTAISPSGKFTMTLNGTYVDTLTNNSGCDSVLFIQFTRDTFSVYLSKSNNISCDSPATYLTTSAGNIFTWFENENIMVQKSATITVAPNTQTLYKVIAQNNLGCLATDSLIVDVNKKDTAVTFPNVFTPNQDGINDCYSIKGIETFHNILFEVYNRWGLLVYKTNNPSFCWNGLANNGEELASGTYYYLLVGTSNCGNPLKTNGTITLLK